MAFVHMQLGNNDPVRIPDDPDVVSVFKARGFEQVDDPTAAGVADESVQVAEVDDHGIGWLHVIHYETGGIARIPNELGVLADFRDKGWKLAGESGDEETFEGATKAELQADLKERGLSTAGTKQELVDRLLQANIRDYEETAVESETEEK